MKKIFLSISLLIIALTCFAANPDEGMWIPLLIEKYNIKLMQERGFRLSAEDIYSVNKACMKDAVVNFDGICTAEIISDKGLLITNYHCGYNRIQQHSTLEHDYLAKGFWAMSGQEELPNRGMTVTILKWMEDVTTRVLTGVDDNMDQALRDSIISSNIDRIRSKAVEGTEYTAAVRPFYMGNQYFLFVNEIFRDIRLVGAPPSAIGKFGGDTDNWIWPRHTGDFSMFRIYADRNNKPADYSPDNVPYKPAYFFPISLKGIKEGDFTMVFGYPGSTSEYVPSYHIDMVKNYLDPKLIDIRASKIRIIDEAMNSDPLIRIQYSARVAGISNSWKKWIGEVQGLERMGTIGRKKEFEERLTNWIESSDTRRAKYADILPAYERLYAKLREYTLANSYTSEVISGVDAFSLARSIRTLADRYRNNEGSDVVEKAKTDLLLTAGNFFKDYNMPADRKLFAEMMKMYGEDLDARWQSPEYLNLKNSCKGNFAAVAGRIYQRSVFTDQARFAAFVAGFGRSSLRRLDKDPLYVVSTGTSQFVAKNVRPELGKMNAELHKLNRQYMKLQMEYDSTRVFYPDANSTLRVSFGKVSGYRPKDAVSFDAVTTLGGVIEKDNPKVYDYNVPGKLRQLFLNHDYGRYGENGELPVCFIADNHTSGGNSGSPVINADGLLIGINFDRAWEGVASDMAFNPDQSRNISLDIRYALFIIDKFAGAGYLLNEMEIVE
ncbi:MAG: S46 family peptidase [Bacteroidales bacterium]